MSSESSHSEGGELNNAKADLAKLSQAMSLLQVKMEGMKSGLIEAEKKEIRATAEFDQLRSDVTDLKSRNSWLWVKTVFAGGVFGLVTGFLPSFAGIVDYVAQRNNVVVLKQQVEEHLKDLNEAIKKLQTNEPIIDKASADIDLLKKATVDFEAASKSIREQIQKFNSEVDVAMRPYRDFKDNVGPRLVSDGTLRVSALEINGVLINRKTMDIGGVNVDALAVSLPIEVHERLVVTGGAGTRVQLMDKSGQGHLHAARGKDQLEMFIVNPVNRKE